MPAIFTRVDPFDIALPPLPVVIWCSAQLKSSFNGALDKWKRWTIKEELSDGCGARDAEWEYDML